MRILNNKRQNTQMLEGIEHNHLVDNSVRVCKRCNHHVVFHGGSCTAGQSSENPCRCNGYQ